MKRVLLVDLPWKGKKYAGRAGMRWAHTSDKTPIVSFRPFPFYLGTCAAYLENAGHKVKVIDALSEQLSEDEFFRRVKEFDPHFILAETHTPSYNNDREYMKMLKEKTDAKLIFCGPHASALPKQVADENEGVIDHVLIGEYEKLTETVVSGKSHGKLLKLKAPLDYNEIPWPARHLFKMSLYNEVFCRDYPNIQMMASRGCPFRCSYCNIFLMCGGYIQRRREPADVIKEMKFCIQKYKPKEIYFDDDNIDADQNWLSDLMDLKIKELPNIPFSCMGHVSIRPELLEKMKKAGCQGIKFGVESTNNEVLRRLKKGITVEMATQTIEKCKELGIKTHLTYCIGLPGDTKETVRETIDYAKSHGDHYQVSIAAPFPGTPLFEEAKREGWINFDTWDDFDGMKDAIINYPDLSSQDLFKIYLEGQSSTYNKVFKTGEWKKYIKMIYQERGIKGLFVLGFIRGPGMMLSVLRKK